ncbi:MAG: penicillin-binding protein, partial [Rhodospirillaceae bacterium]|nr:penicillin-binding protein [Rhodospirillaceae bacterium]
MIRVLAIVFSLILLLVVLAGGGSLYALWQFGRDLPDYSQLADYRPAVMSRVHAGDGTLIGEFAHQRRLFVPIAAMPRRVIQAFLSAEDKTFYTHPGIDFAGIASAVLRNIKNIGGKRRPVGASTITQQLVKNAILSTEQTYTRKIKEMILAFALERRYTKDEILQLYLNEIPYGSVNYGIEAAAQDYYGKHASELSLPEAATLAALPQAPTTYINNPDRLEVRRDWILQSMADLEYLTQEEADVAMAEETPLQ